MFHPAAQSLILKIPRLSTPTTIIMMTLNAYFEAVYFLKTS
jgi:hypothetical protein